MHWQDLHFSYFFSHKFHTNNKHSFVLWAHISFNDTCHSFSQVLGSEQIYHAYQSSAIWCKQSRLELAFDAMLWYVKPNLARRCVSTTSDVHQIKINYKLSDLKKKKANYATHSRIYAHCSKANISTRKAPASTNFQHFPFVNHTETLLQQELTRRSCTSYCWGSLT